MGTRDTGTLLHTSRGNKWRVIFAKTLTHDEDSVWGFTNNHYQYMLGAGYRLILRKHRFDVGTVYIDEQTHLFNTDQYAFWFKWAYPILPRLHCG